MKLNKPLVTIFTYEERQQQQQQINGLSDIKSKDEIDRVVINDCFKKGQAPPPPPLPPSSQKQQQSSDSDGPPMTPIPDYDSTPTDSLLRNGDSPKKINSIKGTMGRCAASEMAKANGDMADMESIESFKLNNPSSPKPRPPSVYFNPQSSGPPTMKKSLKPISVTIGEYVGGRKEPTKFDFIKRNGNEVDDEDVSSRLKNELEKTLSRSNLKKRNETELLDQNRTTVLLNGNGNVNGKPVLQKTQSANIEKLSAMISAHHLNNNNNNSKIEQPQSTNKVTISIPSHPELRKSESSPPNGILKTSANGRSSLTSTNGQEHKNIKFGNITMVIGER